MKQSIKITAFLFIFLCLLIATSCSKDLQREYDFFLIPVDEVYIEFNPAPGKPLEIRLFGQIGHNGCYRFSKFIIEREGRDILVEAWGVVDKTSGKCRDMIVNLEGEKLNCLIEEAGTYNLKIKQPDGSWMERKIVVE
jgi:hypothetical protein